MEKAYDLKNLALRILKAAAGPAYGELKLWAQESAVISENKADDIVAPFLGQLDPIVQPLIDKIGKKEG